MPETLVEALISLDGPTFKQVVDDEIRRKLSPEVIEVLGRLLPAPGPRVRVKHGPPQEPRCIAIHDALLSPDVVERWFIELTTAKRRIERQLAARASELISQEVDPDYDRLRREYHKWRAGVLRFVNAVEDRIDEARVVTHRFHVSARMEAIEADRNALSERVEELTDAIERHHNAKRVVDEIDLTLYELLEDDEYDEMSAR